MDFTIIIADEDIELANQALRQAQLGPQSLNTIDIRPEEDKLAEALSLIVSNAINQAKTRLRQNDIQQQVIAAIEAAGPIVQTTIAVSKGATAIKVQ